MRPLSQERGAPTIEALLSCATKTAGYTGSAMKPSADHDAAYRIFDYRCCGHEREKSAEEETDAYEVVLPRRGLFVRHVRGEAVVGDPNHVLFFNRGETYRVSHPVAGGDHCTVIRFTDTRLRDCLGTFDRDAAEADDGAALFARTHRPRTTEVELLHRRLLHASANASDPLVAEELASQLLGALLDESREPATAARARTQRDHAKLVDATKQELARRLDEKLMLQTLAEAVHSSPFHLSRVFRTRTGLSLSAYHRSLRLRAALERLLEGEDDLTRLALELGFSHHSHFSHAFRREFGMTPSASREGAVWDRRGA